MEKISIQLNNVSREFTSGDSVLRVINEVSTKLTNEKKVAIVGRSGSGKSTLLHMLGTLDKPTTGDISYSGVSVHDMKPDDIASWRNHNIGFIFQFHRLLMDFTALENVMIPGMVANLPVSEVKSKASALLDRFDMGHRKHHKPSALSGGEQQRVAIARALFMDPAIILADEPTGNLDQENSTIVNTLLHEECRKGSMLILVTHNSELSKSMDECWEISNGRLSKKW